MGDLIYDDYLRYESLGTIDAVNNKLECYYQFAFNCFNSYKKLFDEYNGKIIATVQDHTVYIIGGILSRFALARGIQVFSTHGRSSPLVLKKYDSSERIADYVLNISPSSFQFVYDRLDKNAIEAGFQIINEYYVNKKPHNHTLLDAQKFRHYARKDILCQLNLDPAKPVVFIMSHAMSDATHQQGNMLYEDYYQWLIRTLEIVKDIKGVNWVVKEHPFDYAYTKHFTFSSVMEHYEYGYQHIRKSPPDMHPGSLIDAADALVTARSTACLEASVFGKQCIMAGESFISGHGIATEPETEEAYIAALESLEQPSPLSCEIIDRAKAYAYLYLELARVQCDFLPPLPYAALTNISSAEQWAYMTNRLRDTSIEDDPLYKNLMIQLELDFPHILNYDKLGIHYTNGMKSKKELSKCKKIKDSDLTIIKKSSVKSKLVINEETSTSIIKQLNQVLPLVSIITICRNSERTIRRCIESVLSQSYTNIEYIIQDGASTDRTLDIIKEYQDDRIKLVSEPDSGGASEAYFKGLCRCTGNIIGLCWADEEYFPHTIFWGITKLGEHPEAAAIYGDVYATDIDGNIPKGTPNPAPQWDLTKFLCWEIMPNYCSSFFRTSKLKDSGFFERVHSYYNSKPEPNGCIMYDYYAMVGIKYPILYIPDFVAKFSFHKNQLSSTPSVLYSMIPELMRSFDLISNAPETPDSIKVLRYRAYAGFHLMMISSLLSNANAFEDAKTMLNRALSYEPDINFLSKVIIDACNYLNYKGLSNELLEFTDIIIKASLTFPNLHYAMAVALCDLGHYEEAIESIRKEHILQPMHAGLHGLLFKIQLHILLKNQYEYVRGVLNKGILAKYQLREVANILNNLLTTTETEGVSHFLQDMSGAALASLEDIVNACLSAAAKEGTQELINRLKALAATIKAIRITREQTVDVQ
ncbi:MAG TPA: glycosyltransferase [Candidatus Wunengus sp. YC60]|uniref:glycosyltransferase n=1 Tax=Candidatus Wunengus sp. YC60 TaxID=3367697 RepID=UPI0040273CA6